MPDPLDRLTPRQRIQLERVLACLEEDEFAPTSVRDRTRALRTHAADSLIAYELPEVRDAHTIADLGSGAGFPGTVLAVALPDARVSLVESQRRKCEFLERAVASAKIENATVVCSRAEDWRDGTGANDLVVARALAPQAVVLEYAAPLLRIGGALVDWRGRREHGSEQEAATAAAELGMRLREVRMVTPYEGAQDLHLHVFAKEAATPARFPRRAGMARKRPLGR